MKTSDYSKLTKLSYKELTEKYRPLVEASGIFKMEDVLGINHKPHPYKVGNRHIVHASNHCGGMLGETTMRVIPCAHSRCNLPYDQHTCNVVVPLKLIRNATNTEAQKALKAVIDQGMEADGIEGFVFIKTEFEFIKE